jgi:hypothetical protein
MPIRIPVVPKQPDDLGTRRRIEQRIGDSADCSMAQGAPRPGRL